MAASRHRLCCTSGLRSGSGGRFVRGERPAGLVDPRRDPVRLHPVGGVQDAFLAAAIDIEAAARVRRYDRASRSWGSRVFRRKSRFTGQRPLLQALPEGDDLGRVGGCRRGSPLRWRGRSGRRAFRLDRRRAVDGLDGPAQLGLRNARRVAVAVEEPLPIRGLGQIGDLRPHECCLPRGGGLAEATGFRPGGDRHQLPGMLVGAAERRRQIAQLLIDAEQLLPHPRHVPMSGVSSRLRRQGFVAGRLLRPGASGREADESQHHKPAHQYNEIRSHVVWMIAPLSTGC